METTKDKTFSIRPRIGMLWGNFPWSLPPQKLWNLWSVGRVARNLTRALSMFAEVVPFQRPPKEMIRSYASLA